MPSTTAEPAAEVEEAREGDALCTDDDSVPAAQNGG